MKPLGGCPNGADTFLWGMTSISEQGTGILVENFSDVGIDSDVRHKAKPKV